MLLFINTRLYLVIGCGAVTGDQWCLSGIAWLCHTLPTSVNHCLAWRP